MEARNLALPHEGYFGGFDSQSTCSAYNDTQPSLLEGSENAGLTAAKRGDA